MFSIIRNFERDENFGLARSVRSGVTEILDSNPSLS